MKLITTRNDIKFIQKESIKDTVDYLYSRDIKLIELSAKNRESYRDFLYYSGDRIPIAPHMIKKFKENGFKVRILYWRTFKDLFNNLTSGTTHIRVRW